MIAFAIVLVIIGAILLAIASPRKGGNIEIGTSDVKTTLPEITGLAKIPAFILGLTLIGIGLWMGVLLFIKSLETDNKVAENPPSVSTPQVEIKLSSEPPLEPSKTYTLSPTYTSISSVTPIPELPMSTPIQPTPTVLTTLCQATTRKLHR